MSQIRKIKHIHNNTPYIILIEAESGINWVYVSKDYVDYVDYDAAVYIGATRRFNPPKSMIDDFFANITVARLDALIYGNYLELILNKSGIQYIRKQAITTESNYFYIEPQPAMPVRVYIRLSAHPRTDKQPVDYCLDLTPSFESISRVVLYLQHMVFTYS